MTRDRACRRAGPRLALAALEGRPAPRRSRRHAAHCETCGARVARASRARLALSTMGSERSPAPIGLVPAVLTGLDAPLAAAGGHRGRVAAITATAAAVGAGVAVAVVTRRRHLASA
ncbi:MAG: hypothetical protein R6X29_05530 [Acidimicrobiia bacterium]|jgi:hypothetical protein